jgi:predicted phage terminase large subunit-like protein
MQEDHNIPTLTRKRPSKPERMKQALYDPQQIIRELNNRSLYHFMQYFWDEVVNLPFKPNWHIELMCKELEEIAYRVGNREKKVYDLLFNVPPGSTKTITISIMFPVWCWTKWFWMRFITASYSDTASLESAEYSRDLIRSQKFQQMYPELDIKQDKDSKGNFKVIKKLFQSPGCAPRILNGGSRFSTSVGGTVTSFHGDINIWDDLINPKLAVSEAGIKTANDFLDQTLSTRKTDKEISTVIGVMQRLAQHDPTGHLLDKNKTNLRHICLPGEITNFSRCVKPAECIKYYKNDLLDPIRLSWDALKDLEADLGQYGYAGQVGQDPTPPGGGMFKVDHLITLLCSPASINFQETIRYWDKAGTAETGKKRGPCYTVGVKMAKLSNGKYIVLDVKRGRWASEEREAIIREVAEADGPTVKIYIEQEPGSGGKESAEATIRNLSGFSCIADLPTGDKVYRADPFSVQVNIGSVLLLKADWNTEFIEELRFFPFSTYKDQVDAGSGAFNHLACKRMAKAW